MKIEHIQVDNFLGAHQIAVTLKTPITLFAGPNGACKSSIAEAVRMAMGHDVVRVKLKKDYEQLVTDGSKAGGALIILDDERSYAFNVPAGDFTADDTLPTGPNVDISLNGQRFASMTADERRTYLFGLANIKPKAEDIKKRMIERACEPAKIDATLPMLRAGFPAACEFAKNKATEAKGSWRTLTGEAYGKVKADGWKAQSPVALEGAAPAEGILTAFDEDIGELNKHIGEISAEMRTRTENAAKRTALAAKAATVDRVGEALEHAAQELVDLEPKVIELRQRAAGTARVGIVHDMAIFLDQIKFDDEEKAQEADVLLDRYETEFGEIVTAGAIDVDAKNSLPEYERGLETMRNAVQNFTRDLAAAREAKAQFDALAPAEKQEDLADIEVLKASLTKMREERTAVQEKITAFATFDQAVEAANKKTKDAGKHHSDVAAWSVVADALAPDGIPGDLLVEALKPINECLQDQFDMLGWVTQDGHDIQAVIHADMQITLKAGRPYHLLSESERWRMDAMIAATAAKLSGIKILMLDRVDVLDLPSRGTLLGWVNTLVEEGDIDTVLLFATLKARPAALMPTMTAHWVEIGEIIELQEAA